MARVTPMAFRWDGEAFVPLHRRRANAELIVGKIYWLAETHDEPSARSRRHQFAVLARAWETLPEAYKDEFPTVEHLRKRALIEAGFYHESAINVGDNATAGRLAVSLQRRDKFALVFVRGDYLIERIAQSQATMDRETFQKSKDAIFEIVANMVGVTVDELSKESERTT